MDPSRTSPKRRPSGRTVAHIVAAAERDVTNVFGSQFHYSGLDGAQVEIEGGLDRTRPRPARWQAAFMIGDLQSCQRDLGFLACASDRPRDPSTSGSNWVSMGLDIHAPDTVANRDYAAAPAVSSTVGLVGNMSSASQPGHTASIVEHFKDSFGNTLTRPSRVRQWGRGCHGKAKGEKDRW
jgi:hypothetical protein